MGMQHMAFAIAGGLGPLSAGFLADVFDSHRPGVVMMVASVLVSVVFLHRSR